jgi:hypothetical protein
MDAELQRHIAELERRAERYEPQPWPRLTDDERADVHVYMEKLAAERTAHAAAQEQRLISTGRHLAREVLAYRMTLADAERRLEALVSQSDDRQRAEMLAREAFGATK